MRRVRLVVPVLYETGYNVVLQYGRGRAVGRQLHCYEVLALEVWHEGPGSCATTPNRCSAALRSRSRTKMHGRSLRPRIEDHITVGEANRCGLNSSRPRPGSQFFTKAPMSDHKDHEMDIKCYTAIHQSRRHSKEEYARGISLQGRNLEKEHGFCTKKQLHAAESRHQTQSARRIAIGKRM